MSAALSGVAPATPVSSGMLAPLVDALTGLGEATVFSFRASTGLISRHFRFVELIRMCYEVGVSSLSVVAVTGTFIGMVLAVQAYGQFHQIGLDTSLGAVIHMSVVRELGPVLTAVMLAGRVGSAMAAQLGTMKVTEQIDALACLGVDPVKYLAGPRIFAAILMIPLLTIFADLMGLFGSTLICLKVYGIEPFHYWRHTREFVTMWDVTVGLFKSVCFGFIVASISCYRGFRATAGAEGVGRAATEAFVHSFVAILAVDFVLGLFANGLYELIWPGMKGNAIGGEPS
jgi:phospholipid/cholesterol/gamma-HCH transport system permease protein